MLRNALILLWMIAGLSAHADTPAEEARKLSGTWIAAEAQRDGRPAPEDIGHQLAFNGDRFIITSDGQPVYSGTFTIDPAVQPAQITLVHTDGQATGRTWEGIYRLEGRKLTICDDAFDTTKARPTRFATSAGSGHVLITFTRQ
jgi:uncharacterized protein (TIGR03067 family)